MNLFSRLYKYQSSDERSQLENFCTEGLCDILNRLTAPQQQRLLSRLGLQQYTESKIVWETQYSITDEVGHTRYPDLVGIIDHSVHYLIEVKIDASFTSGMSVDGKVLSQLQIYDRWLASHSISHQEVSFALLTCRTMPDPDFVDECSSKFQIKNRKVLYWQSIYEYLEEISDIPHIQDFQQFLTLQGLAMDLPTRQDFAVMELLYSGAGSRLDGLMNTVFEKLKQKYTNEVLFNWNLEDKWRFGGSRADWGAAICWSWVIFQDSPYQYFYWGIQFPEYDTEWNVTKKFSQNGSAPQLVFAYVACGDERITKAQKHFAAHQYLVADAEDESEVTIFQRSLAINQLLDTGYNVDTVVDWLSKEFDQAISVIKEME